MRWIRTQGLLLVPVVACAVLLAARSEPAPPVGRPAATTASEEYFTGRQLAYLTFATSEQHPGSVANVVMHMERARVDPSYTAPLGLAGPDAWDSLFAKIADLEDTSDFDMLYLLNAYLGYNGDPVVAPELWQKVEDAILGFKFWYDQPTPAGVIDDMWYWSENHQIIFHTLEYLAGQTFPNQHLRDDWNDRRGASGARAGQDPGLARPHGPLRLQGMALERLLPEGRDAASHAGRVRRRGGDPDARRHDPGPRASGPGHAHATAAPSGPRTGAPTRKTRCRPSTRTPSTW